MVDRPTNWQKRWNTKRTQKNKNNRQILWIQTRNFFLFQVIQNVWLQTKQGLLIQKTVQNIKPNNNITVIEQKTKLSYKKVQERW